MKYRQLWGPELHLKNNNVIVQDITVRFLAVVNFTVKNYYLLKLLSKNRNIINLLTLICWESGVLTGRTSWSVSMKWPDTTQPGISKSRLQKIKDFRVLLLPHVCCNPEGLNSALDTSLPSASKNQIHYWALLYVAILANSLAFNLKIIWKQLQSSWSVVGIHR